MVSHVGVKYDCSSRKCKSKNIKDKYQIDNFHKLFNLLESYKVMK